jgi:hypothetical protein
MSSINWESFGFAIWHPFGSHGRELPHDILNRKRGEIERNGWTLWSFQFRKILDEWYRQIGSAKHQKIVVLCSRGTHAVDPDRPDTLSRAVDCTRYRLVNEMNWRHVPTTIRVPHPFRPGKQIASAVHGVMKECQLGAST